VIVGASGSDETTLLRIIAGPETAERGSVAVNGKAVRLVGRELERLWQDSGATMIMVTHDIEEAAYLADKIVVMGDGFEGSSEVIPVPLPRPRDRSNYDFVGKRCFAGLNNTDCRMLSLPFRDQELSLALEAECLLIRRKPSPRGRSQAEARHFQERWWDGSCPCLTRQSPAFVGFSHQQARSV